MRLCYHCMHQIEKDAMHTCPNCGRSLSKQPIHQKYLQPGTVLQGKFVVGYPLGAGGFGNTYIGWNQTLFCKVAIKEFYPEQYCHRASDGISVAVSGEKQQARFEKGLRQFLEEARSVAALQDIPGVVRISSFFEENQTGYIVMEYLEGMDVKNILSRSGGRKEYEWCRRVTLTVLHTLREVHRRGVLHRDIAPDNIFVTSEGIIKLIDFGAAKQISALSSSKPDIMLKVGYAPIEQYSRSAPQGPYTDLYGVAALFYRMLTGQRPIPANERLDQDGLIPPSEMGIQIPEQAEMGMMICLNVQAKYRLQSADEFMEALGGQDFVPVYETEWILPPMEEKKGLWEKLLCLPAAAWGGVGLGCICLVGLLIFAIVRLGGGGPAEEALASGAIVMNDLTGMTEKEALESIQELEKRAREEGVILDMEVQTNGYIFDLDEDKDGTVASQTVKPFSVLYDPDVEEQEELEGLERDEEGNITGTIFCDFYSGTRLLYSDISGLNAYAMAQKLGIDTGDTEHFTGTDEEGDSCYYDLIRLETPDGEITAEALSKKKNRKREITYEKGQMRIVYSNIPFFYWESLPDFKQTYGTLNDIPMQDTYIWKNESDRELAGQKKFLQTVRGMVDTDYCVITSSENSKGFHEGDIIRQTFPAGGELDTSSTKLEEAMLHVVGNEIFYSGKNGNQLKNEIQSLWGENVQVAAGGSKVMTQPVLSVTVTDEAGTALEYFRKGDAVTVTLELRAEPLSVTNIPVPETPMVNTLTPNAPTAASPTSDASGTGNSVDSTLGAGDTESETTERSPAEPAFIEPDTPEQEPPVQYVPDVGNSQDSSGGNDTGGSDSDRGYSDERAISVF